MNVKPSKNCLEIGQISKLAEGDPHLTLIFNRISRSILNIFKSPFANSLKVSR